MSKIKVSKRLEGRQIALIAGFAAILAVLGLIGSFVMNHDGSADTTPAILPPIEFSEVMTANASAVADDYGAYADWFEIENAGERDVDLTGWMVLRDSEKLDVFTFGRQIIAPGERIVVFCGNHAQNNPAYVLHAPFGLTASGDSLTLLDASGNVIDTVATPALERNQAYALIDGDWRVTPEYTPGMANTNENYIALVSEGDGETVAEEVVISEVMVRNKGTIADKNGAYSDYVELYNSSSRTVSLKGYMLSDDDAAPEKFVFPDVSIKSGGYLLVFCSGVESKADELHAAFKLSEGETVTLRNAQGRILSQVTPQVNAANQAWSLTKNGWTAYYPPTPGYANDETGLAAIDSAVTATNTSHLHISEIMASTDDTTLSKEGYDWIEIYNDAGGKLDLSGWGLSDSASHPRKWQFPAGASIDAGQYMIVFCSGLDTKSGSRYHTNFSLSTEGGYTITLSDPNGGIVDQLAVGQQYSNISYGRSYGVAGMRYFTEPTPGAANDTYGYTGRAQQASYSVQGGLFDEGEVLTVALSAAPGSSIYYTTDCTEPTAASTLYTGPITISGNTILRTRVFSSSEIPSFVATQSYFFGLRHSMRVVSLVLEPDDLWSEEKGIYIAGPNATDTYPYGSLNKGANFWMDWEKAGNIEMYTASGEVMISQGCGVKLQGQYSRAEDQKAFKIYARTQYSGDNRFHAALFSDRPYTEYQSFILRASGQDGKKTRIRDVLQTSLADNTSVMYQAAEMCVVYLNGEYWGHYNIREHINKYSIAQWMGWTSDPNDIDLVKANRGVMQGSNETFEELLNWIKTGGGATARSKKETLTQADYDEILAHIEAIVDVDNYLDYVTVQIYTGNTDLLNVKRYRSADEDGKWRWILFDMDWGMNILDTNQMRRWLDPAGAGSGKKTDNTLFIELMMNPAIQDRFLKRFNELYVSTFNTQEVLRRMSVLYNELEPEIDRHLARWNVSRSQYDKSWDDLRNIAIKRPELMMGYIQDTFSLTDAQMNDYFGPSLKLIEQYKAEHS